MACGLLFAVTSEAFADRLNLEGEAFADQIALGERDFPTRGVWMVVSKAITRSTSASRPLNGTTSHLDVAQDARPGGSVTVDVDQLRLETAGISKQGDDYIRRLLAVRTTAVMLSHAH
jgi:hypothetical protein